MTLSTVGSTRPRSRSCSLETILDDSAPLTRQQLFMSNDSLSSCAYSSRSHDDSPDITTLQSRTDLRSAAKATPITSEIAPQVKTRRRPPVVSASGLSVSQRSRDLRPRSIGSCLDIVVESREEDVIETRWQGRAASCINVNNPAEQHHSFSGLHPSSSSFYHPVPSLSSSAMAKAQGSQASTGPSGPRPASSTSNLLTLRAPAAVRRCLSSLDVSKPCRPVSLFKLPVFAPVSTSQHPQPKPEHSKSLSPLPVCVCLSVNV